MPNSLGKAGVRYMPQLDGIRAFAVGAVILEHWASVLPEPLRKTVRSIDFGGLGVECFFVLSGFLITLILLELKDQRLSFGAAVGRFYARRVLRIFPAYYLALLATALLLPQMRPTLGWHALYLSNIYAAWHGAWPPAGGHFWSLAVEEQFYLFWPFAVLMLPCAAVKRVAVTGIALAVISRLLIWQLAGAAHIAIWTFTPSALDLLCFGALLACMWREDRLGRESKAMSWLALAGAFAFGCYIVGHVFLHDKLPFVAIARTLTAIFFGTLIACAANGLPGAAGRVLSSRWLVWLGLISYGLYIWHPFIPALYLLIVDASGLDHDVFASFYIHLPLLAALLLLVTASSYYLVERPIRSLRRFFMAGSPRRVRVVPVGFGQMADEAPQQRPF